MTNESLHFSTEKHETTVYLWGGAAAFQFVWTWNHWIFLPMDHYIEIFVSMKPLDIYNNELLLSNTGQRETTGYFRWWAVAFILLNMKPLDVFNAGLLHLNICKRETTGHFKQCVAAFQHLKAWSHWIFLSRYHYTEIVVSMEPLDIYNKGLLPSNIGQRETTGYLW